MDISNNLTHLIMAIAVLAAGVVLIIVGHTYVDVAYVYGTTFTLVGSILGFNFGVATPSPTQAQALSDAQEHIAGLQATVTDQQQRLHAAGAVTLTSTGAVAQA